MRLLFDARPLVFLPVPTTRHATRQETEGQSAIPPLDVSLHHTLHLHLHTQTSARLADQSLDASRTTTGNAELTGSIQLTRQTRDILCPPEEKPLGSIVSLPFAARLAASLPLTSPSCVPPAHCREGAVPMPHVHFAPKLTLRPVTNSCHLISLPFPYSPQSSSS